MAALVLPAALGALVVLDAVRRYVARFPVSSQEPVHDSPSAMAEPAHSGGLPPHRVLRPRGVQKVEFQLALPVVVQSFPWSDALQPLEAESAWRLAALWKAFEVPPASRRSGRPQGSSEG